MTRKPSKFDIKSPVEIIQLDEGSSFRVLHQKVSADEFQWNYHCHPEIEIVFVKDGVGRRHVGNHLSYYQDGDLVLIGSNLPHAGFGMGSSGLHEEVVVQFKNDIILDGQLGVRPELQQVSVLFEKSKHGICFYGNTKRNVGEKLKILNEMSPFQKYITVMDILGELAISHEYILLSDISDYSSLSQKDQSRVKKILNHIELNYQQPIDIKAVAESVNLSVPAFCNYFKKVVNHTYTDFVNEFRIERACQHLLTDKSISDICFECGFLSQSYFSKVFKKVKRKTPLEFKNELLKRG
jgi:AraC-like DNA-binding protein/mannose-6-phosphate isomerase-like protein (cupin superfamily)